MQQIISNIGSFLWGPPMIIAIMGCGILLTVRSKFFVFRYFGLIFRKTLGSMKSSGQKRAGKFSPFEAICVAVGGAVGHNPISILIPCHRVVGSDGSLTGYAGGVANKQFLLELEGVDMTGLYVPTRGTAL